MEDETRLTAMAGKLGDWLSRYLGEYLGDLTIAMAASFVCAMDIMAIMAALPLAPGVKSLIGIAGTVVWVGSGLWAYQYLRLNKTPR